MQEQHSTPREKVWNVRADITPPNREKVEALRHALGRSSVVSTLLALRGYDDPKTASDFLYLKTEMLCDPFAMMDMEKGVLRIAKALENGEKIVIYGDYDVDGVTAVCTLYLYLKGKGANIEYYIPNRMGEGYGVTVAAVDRLADEGATLIITVDTGITAAEEVAHATARGVDFVVTDHHECRSDLPLACAVINPHRPDDTYPFPDLAGVGVVFKLLCALEKHLSGDSLYECVGRICNEYADLVAIGTIADVMPVKGENKIIVKYGLSLISDTKRPGLRALLDAVSVTPEDKKPKKKAKITSGFIGFTIAPRINAAGRIRSASEAVELFLSQEEEKAAYLAEQLCEANRERQAEENRITQEAYEKISAEHDFSHDRVIVLDSDSWHHGIIGIVSSRITEHYGLPSILISFEGADKEGDEAVGKGSGRSVKGMNLVDALVNVSDCLVKFGGHELAAGLSVTRGRLEEFRRRINAYAEEALSGDALVPTLDVDMELTAGDINMALAEELQLLEPYGSGNPMPVFVLRDMDLVECQPISGGKHTRMTVSRDGRNFQAMFFSCPTSRLNLFVGDRVDLVFTLDINEYNGRRTVQLIGRDARVAQKENLRRRAEQETFEAVWSGEPFTDEGIIPTREDFAAVYTLVRRHVRNGVEEMSLRALLTKLNLAGCPVGYVKLKLIIKILQEMNVLGIEEIGEEYYRFSLYYSDQKTDLEKSNLLRRLRLQYRQPE